MTKRSSCTSGFDSKTSVALATATSHLLGKRYITWLLRRIAMRLWTTFDYVRQGWTLAKNASLSTTVSGNSNLGALKTGFVPEKGTKATPRIRRAKKVPWAASRWKRGFVIGVGKGDT